MCGVIARALEIRVAFRDGWRWPIRDTDIIEVWRGQEHVGSLSGETVRHLIQHHMTGFEVQRAISDELSGRRPFVYVTPLRRPLAAVPFTREARAALRARRRTRRR